MAEVPEENIELENSWDASIGESAAEVLERVACATGCHTIALIGTIIHQSDAEYLEEQIDRGRLLLFVRTKDQEHEKIAMEILSKHSAYDPKIYSVPSSSPIAA